MRNAIVVLQMLTMVALAIFFFRDGNYRLAAAQVCYVVATAVLFVR